ncbi:unnamed protein product [Durusdinium trenchii]|uniref:EGF-like domain-containing protein n=2 Tax=Durusdinium trenchii TaxID=1381693 RepID=A0ABP0QU72_9DINO
MGQILQPAFSVTRRASGYEVASSGDAMENESNSTTTSSSTTVTTTFTAITTTVTSTVIGSQNWTAIPYCLCQSDRTQTLQCETGAGQACVTNFTDPSDCFEEGTLCEASVGCVTRPSIQANCAVYTTQEACEEQRACYYRFPGLLYRMACRSMGANANNSQALAACSEFNHKVACDKQAICHWTITEYHGELCENGGVHVGCGGLASQLDSRCAIHRTLSSCQVEPDICTWKGLCTCTPEFFGDTCEKERVPFQPGGVCVESITQPAICKGLVIAASVQDRDFCSPGQDCTAWDELTARAGLMYEAELGHTLVDAIAILFCFWAVFSKRKAGCRNILRATLLSFTADVALEALLADTALGAKAAALELRDAFCVSGHSTAMMSLSHLPSVIATLAWVNMGLAIVGCTSQLASIFASLRQKEVLEMVAIVLIVFIALLEGIFGAISFSHTGDFTAVLLELEAAALGRLTPMP